MAEAKGEQCSKRVCPGAQSSRCPKSSWTHGPRENTQEAVRGKQQKQGSKSWAGAEREQSIGKGGEVLGERVGRKRSVDFRAMSATRRH